MTFTKTLKLIMSLISSAVKLYAYVQKVQGENLQLAKDLAAALANDEADQSTIDAAVAKVAELQAVVDSGVGVDSSDETALAEQIETLLNPPVEPPVEPPVA